MNTAKKTSRLLTNHTRALLFATGDMLRQPLSSLLTILVIAISFALPFGLHQLINCLTPIEKQIDTTPNISIYTQPSLATNELNNLTNQLTQLPQTQHIRYISPEQGLKEFSHYTQMQNISSTLQKNPLPGLTDHSKYINLIHQWCHQYRSYQCNI